MAQFYKRNKAQGTVRSKFGSATPYRSIKGVYQMRKGKRLADLNQISREWRWEKGAQDSIGVAVKEQIQKQLGDLKFNIAQEIRSAAAAERRFGTGGSPGTFSDSTPHVSARTGVARPGNRVARDSLNSSYTGTDPQSRIKGKGRSSSLADAYRPSLELQPMDPPDRRIGSLTGSSGRGGQSVPTMLSRFGANKDHGSGLMGASASRLRGAKNLMAHPETWMKRYAPFWIASEVSRGYTNWRGWNKVSYDMTNTDANKALNNPSSFSESAVRSVGGTLTNTAINVMSPFMSIGAAAYNWTTLSLLTGKRSEADMARAVATIGAFGNWAQSGFKGQNPISALESSDEEVLHVADSERSQARKRAQSQFDHAVEDGLVRYKDTLAIRGVGGVDDVSRNLKRRDDFKAILNGWTTRELGQVNDSEILEKVSNKNLAQYKD